MCYYNDVVPQGTSIVMSELKLEDKFYNRVYVSRREYILTRFWPQTETEKSIRNNLSFEVLMQIKTQNSKNARHSHLEVFASTLAFFSHLVFTRCNAQKQFAFANGLDGGGSTQTELEVLLRNRRELLNGFQL